ncbi:MAG: hypothetical protein ABIP48_12630 [Planctomycetota bacterium]
MNYVDTNISPECEVYGEAMARKKDVGTIGMKVFGAGSVFGPRSRRGRRDKPETDRRAHVLLKEKLQDERISAIIPGVKILEHLDENVKATRDRAVPTSTEEGRAIRQCKESSYANLAPQYQWLRNWEVA